MAKIWLDVVYHKDKLGNILNEVKFHPISNHTISANRRYALDFDFDHVDETIEMIFENNELILFYKNYMFKFDGISDLPDIFEKDES